MTDNSDDVEEQAGDARLRKHLTLQEYLEHLEDLEYLEDHATENPLYALREYPHLLSEYRLDACAVAEPAAALLYAYDLLTPERRAWCTEAAREVALSHFVPDRLQPERRLALARARGLEP
jgi:hypothetical protein